MIFKVDTITRMFIILFGNLIFNFAICQIPLNEILTHEKNKKAEFVIFDADYELNFTYGKEKLEKRWNPSVKDVELAEIRFIKLIDSLYRAEYPGFHKIPNVKKIL